MNSISRLPPECLQLILQILTDDNNVAALAALLRVDKHFATATQPFLYDDPYRPTFHKAPAMRGKFHSSLLLTRMLVGRVHPAATPPLLPPSTALSAGLPLNVPETTSSLDYMACIRHLSLTSLGMVHGHVWSPVIEDYITTDVFTAFCRPDQLPLRGTTSDLAISRMFLPIVICRDALWTLASPILEQLQSLVIPVADLARYLTVVDRLSSLERIQFLLDDAFDHDEKQAWRSMVNFVKAHIQLFKGGLTTVRFPVQCMDRFIPHACPKEIQLEIFQSLPSLRKVTSITSDNLLQILAHPLQMDLGRVQLISGVQQLEPTTDTSLQLEPVLQRCRTLKRLNTGALGADSFKWAVQEKRRKNGLDDAYDNNAGPGHGFSSQDMDLDLESLWQNGLVPLADVKITEGSMPLTNEVNDIAFAFSETLSRLEFNTSRGFRHPTRSFSFGQKWVNLPVLTTLLLNTERDRLKIDALLLKHCPNLVEIKLSDHTLQYRCRDLVTCQPGLLFSLETLSLSG
ncbi:hypothetical protein BGZ47_000071 [Haplosporangium gracile]|nr:hypothetical protein BGZ47_000071 [Haplosporangium gracile]